MIGTFVGVASTVIGLVCYAVSTSFINLIGNWNLLKISLYITFSFVICLAITFPKAWQQWWIFKHRAHFTFLILASTTVYSFDLGRKLKTKPNAYDIISSAAFAMTSLCISKQIDLGFIDLLNFFCGVLITQLLEIQPLFGLAGMFFSYLLIILRTCLDDPPKPKLALSLSLRSLHDPDELAIDMAPLLQSLSNSTRSSHHPQQGTASIRNQRAIAAAIPSSASLRHRYQFPIEEEDSSLSVVDSFPPKLLSLESIISLPRVYSFLPGSWINYNHLTKLVLDGDWFMEMFEGIQRRLWNQLQNNLLNDFDNNDEPLWHKMLNNFSEHFRSDPWKSLENIAFQRIFEQLLNHNEGEPKRLATGTLEIDRRLQDKREKLKLD